VDCLNAEQPIEYDKKPLSFVSQYHLPFVSVGADDLESLIIGRCWLIDFENGGHKCRQWQLSARDNWVRRALDSCTWGFDRN
jgi:hypothetical protein